MASAVMQYSYGSGHHTHLLKVDETVYQCTVSLMDEGHVFEEERHKGDDGRGQLGKRQSVHTMIPGWVQKLFEGRI